ncbi:MULTISPECIES: RDD family protein [Marinifilum]|uniref:RDD family protein n=1 Tax=Marinifilum TaxID=866673 RepID=UPI002493007E|nr:MULTISPECIES: RDD family protein [Marinifilum]MDQ2180506.1 RDD family protein [Marinifilum sp. D714]
MTEKHYPGIPDRIKAVICDSIVIIIFMFTASYLFAKFENVPDNARLIAFVFIFGLYDPIFTSLFGGTIGHFMLGIRVKKEKNKDKNILFPFALIRFIVKAILGWISLLTVAGNEKRKAIHDHLVGSVVIYSDPETDDN